MSKPMTDLTIPNAWAFFMLGYLNYLPTYGTVDAALCAFKQTQTAEEKTEVTAFLKLAAQSSDEALNAAYAEYEKLNPMISGDIPYVEPLLGFYVGCWEAWQNCP
jgi:hypothetical protein